MSWWNSLPVVESISAILNWGIAILGVAVLIFGCQAKRLSSNQADDMQGQIDSLRDVQNPSPMKRLSDLLEDAKGIEYGASSGHFRSPYIEGSRLKFFIPTVDVIEFEGICENAGIKFRTHGEHSVGVSNRRFTAVYLEMTNELSANLDIADLERLPSAEDSELPLWDKRK